MDSAFLHFIFNVTSRKVLNAAVSSATVHLSFVNLRMKTKLFCDNLKFIPFELLSGANCNRFVLLLLLFLRHLF